MDEQEKTTGLKKKLNLYGLTMIAVGACIGSGIFVTPADIVSEVPNATLIIFVWILGGVLALTGALTFAELASLFPKAGGVYVFLKEAYGDQVGFIYGWVILLVINTGALAALSVAFTGYLTFFIPLGATAKMVIAILTILGLTTINIFGVDISQLFANVFTGLKLLAITAIIAVGFYYYDSVRVPIDFSLSETPDNIINALMVALIGVLFSMGGWHHTSFMSGEAIDAPRSVPKAMVFGVLIVTITYVFVNLAYMMLLPLPEIASTERVAGDAIATVIPGGGKLVAIAITISIFGTIGIYTMTAPRIYFAMARDGVFFPQLSKLHPRYKTPVNAMLTQAIWAIILILFWQSFGNLITYVTFMDIIFMTMAGFSIFIFRHRLKDKERIVKTPLYPLVPSIFISISAAFVVSTLLSRPEQTIGGLLVLALGFPVYYYFKRQNISGL